MKRKSIITLIISALLAVSLFAWAGSGPNRLTNRAACRRWTSGNNHKACVACVKQGKTYFRKTGQCR